VLGLTPSSGPGWECREVRWVWPRIIHAIAVVWSVADDTSGVSSPFGGSNSGIEEVAAQSIGL